MTSETKTSDSMTSASMTPDNMTPSPSPPSPMPTLPPNIIEPSRPSRIPTPLTPRPDLYTHDGRQAHRLTPTPSFPVDRENPSHTTTTTIVSPIVSPIVSTSQKQLCVTGPSAHRACGCRSLDPDRRLTAGVRDGCPVDDSARATAASPQQGPMTAVAVCRRHKAVHRKRGVPARKSVPT